MAFSTSRIDDALWGETRYRSDANGQVAEARFGDGFSERFDVLLSALEPENARGFSTTRFIDRRRRIGKFAAVSCVTRPCSLE